MSDWESAAIPQFIYIYNTEFVVTHEFFVNTATHI